MKISEMKSYNGKKNLMLVAGGTGGHIYPSLSLINNMKNFNFIIITDHRGKGYYKRFFENKAFSFKIFTHHVTSPSNKKIIYKIISFFQILVSLLKSFLIIISQKPNIAIGFGGYPSVAPMLAAKICIIPLIIHEQNAVIGRGNKLLSKISNVLALSFLETKKTENINNIIFTGNPVRHEFEEIGNNCINSIANKPFTILIYGGSLGASYFSIQLTSIICSLPKKIRNKIKIIQQVRIEDLNRVKNNYKINNIKAEVATYFNNISAKFRIAHLIITRSGGSSVAEILASCKPAIFVPLPNAFDNHQYENAKFLKDNNCGWVIDQNNDDKNNIKKLLQEIFNDKNEIIRKSKQIAKLSQKLFYLRENKTSSEYLSDLILKMINNPKKGHIS